MDQGQLLSILNQTTKEDSFFLGAGCSIQSGCPSSKQLVLDFKQEIFCREKGILMKDFPPGSDYCLSKLTEYFQNDRTDSPYSYYFQKCFPDPEDRVSYISKRFKTAKPSLGYILFAHFIVERHIHFISTTNFDQLIAKSLMRVNGGNAVPIETESIRRPVGADQIVCELHGDFFYDSLKNTTEEVSELSEEFTQRVLPDLSHKIFVFGYSGSDKSIQALFIHSLTVNSAATIYWCYLKKDGIPKIAQTLANQWPSKIRLVEINGFDDVFVSFTQAFGTEASRKELEFVKTPKIHQIFKSSNLNTEVYGTVNLHRCISLPEIHLFPSESQGPVDFVDKYQLPSANVNYSIYFACNDDIFQRSLDIKGLPRPSTIRLKMEDAIKKPTITFFYSLMEKTSFEKCTVNAKRHILCQAHPVELEPRSGIFEGLHYTFLNFNDELMLDLSYQLYVNSDEPSESQKETINAKISNLYNNSRFLAEDKLIKEFFGTTGVIEISYGSTMASFDCSPLYLGFQNSDDYQADIALIPEPTMITKTGIRPSENQISLVNSQGPSRGPFQKKEINVGVFCPSDVENHFQPFINQLRLGTKEPQKFRSLFPPFPGFQRLTGIELNLVWLNHDRPFLTRQFDKFTGPGCAQRVANACKMLYEVPTIDVVIVCFPTVFEKFRKNEDTGFDFHDYLKLLCASKYKTQLLEESTLSSPDDINKKLFNLAIAIYSKTVGIPWRPSVFSEDKAFIGIGFGLSKEGPIVACSQMFDGAGRGLKLILRKISCTNRRNPYMSKDEAYHLGVDLLSLYSQISKTTPLQKIVIHKTTPFRQEEISGFSQAFQSIEDVQMYWIKDRAQFEGFRCNNGQKALYQFPIKRGTILKTNPDEFALWTDGSIVGIIPNQYNYYQSKRGIPKPISVVCFYGKASMEEAATEILFLSKMNINSADEIYNRMPVTLQFASNTADIIKQTMIANTNLFDDPIDYTFVM